MIRAFVDSSVLFSACLSTRGASHEIIRESLRGNVDLVISRLVLQEAKRNLAQKAPQAVLLFSQFLTAVSFEVVGPSKHEVLQAAAYTELKDAPIVAAAKKAQVDFLVSLDRRHLVGIQTLQQSSGLTIVLPETLLSRLRASQKAAA